MDEEDNVPLLTRGSGRVFERRGSAVVVDRKLLRWMGSFCGFALIFLFFLNFPSVVPKDEILTNDRAEAAVRIKPPQLHNHSNERPSHQKPKPKPKYPNFPVETTTERIAVPLVPTRVPGYPPTTTPLTPLSLPLKRLIPKISQKKTDTPKTIPQQPSNPIAEAVNPNENAEEFNEKWECGTAAVSKIITQRVIGRDCPSLLHVVNQCCKSHDLCYDNQLGQTDCDDGFCRCLKTVTYSPTNETSRCHYEHGPWFCQMVKAFGSGYYDNAGLNTTLHSGFIDIYGEEPTKRLPLQRVADEANAKGKAKETKAVLQMAPIDSHWPILEGIQ